MDETDIEILRLLVDDSRRPYSDIAEEVDVSAPTVSDRIDRLEERGVIESFTLDIDWTTISGGTEVVVDVELSASADDGVADRFAAVDEVEHVFFTADARLLATATIRPDRVRSVLSEALDPGAVDSYRVHLVEDRVRAPSIDGEDDETTRRVEFAGPDASVSRND